MVKAVQSRSYGRKQNLKNIFRLLCLVENDRYVIFCFLSYPCPRQATLYVDYMSYLDFMAGEVSLVQLYIKLCYSTMYETQASWQTSNHR